MMQAIALIQNCFGDRSNALSSLGRISFSDKPFPRIQAKEGDGWIELAGSCWFAVFFY
jgi:hypothetical protein